LATTVAFIYTCSQGGAVGAPAPPGAVTNFFQAQFTGKMCEWRQSQFLGHSLLGRLDLEVYLNCLLWAMTKKRLSTFLMKRVHPQTKSWLCLCLYRTEDSQLAVAMVVAVESKSSWTWDSSKDPLPLFMTSWLSYH